MKVKQRLKDNLVLKPWFSLSAVGFFLGGRTSAVL
jgi:hypothetical protein